MGNESLVNLFNKAKPYLGVLFLQFAFVGNVMISKYALNKGMNQYVVVVYRHAIAFLVISPFALVLERKTRPKMTLPIFIKISFLALLEPVVDQNLYYAGVKCTSATFATAIYNVLPAFAFIMAWICRLEKVNLKRIHSQVKILGTIVTVGGAMIMTLVTGPMLHLPWTQPNSQHAENSSMSIQQDRVKGALLMSLGCFCLSAFTILQAITLKSYPAPLSLTALICLVGTLQGTILAMAIERRNTAVWSIHMDSQLLTALYSGIVCSALKYYIQGVVIRAKGPVFVTAFSPLRIILVAILSSLFLSEMLSLGKVVGAIVIIAGIYLVLWGKSKNQISSKKAKTTALTVDQLKDAKDEHPDKDCVVMVKTDRPRATTLS